MAVSKSLIMDEVINLAMRYINCMCSAACESASCFPKAADLICCAIAYDRYEWTILCAHVLSLLQYYACMYAVYRDRSQVCLFGRYSLQRTSFHGQVHLGDGHVCLACRGEVRRRGERIQGMPSIVHYWILLMTNTYLCVSMDRFPAAYMVWA